MDTRENVSFTVFIGIYNGQRYLPSLLTQLQSQLDSNFDIVVVDNASSDGSWSALQEWKKIFGNRLKLEKNHFNLGGGGSLHRALNSGLLIGGWFTQLHQDDLYLPNHIFELRKAIMARSKDEVAVFTSMGSMLNSGQIKPTHPRISWLITDSSRTSQFLLNLRSQSLSWPSTAFNTKVFTEVFRSWHNPAFSDTEATLLLCGHGTFKFIAKETMRYRENPESESHVVEKLESVIAASISLARVISSEEFVTVLKSVEIKLREKFFLELISSLEIRLGQSPLSSFIKLLASERCAQVWEFTDLTSNHYLSQNYDAIGGNFTAHLLKNLIPNIENPNLTGLDKSIKPVLILLADQKIEKILSSNLMPSTRNQAWRIMSHFPLKLRIMLFRIYVRVRSIKQPKYIWNTRWK